MPRWARRAGLGRGPWKETTIPELDLYVAAADRYDAMPYRRTGRSGLQLPAVSFGLLAQLRRRHAVQRQRDILRRAFDLGVTHFDLANNYGPPYGSAETNVAGSCRDDFARLPRGAGPLDQGRVGHVARSVRRPRLAQVPARARWTSRCAGCGLDYVDIFYHHRFDPDTPLEETMGALDAAVRRARRGTSASPRTPRSGPARRRPSWASSARRCSSTSRPTRCSTAGSRTSCSTCSRAGVGCIGFSALAQGMLTYRYLQGVPEDSRAAQDKSLAEGLLTDENLEHIRALNGIAEQRGQTLAQMAIAWVLRDPRVTTALIGASSVAQLEDSVQAVQGLDFSDEELTAIDEHAVEGGINLWEEPSTA